MITALAAETLSVWLLTAVLGLVAVFAVIRYRQETKARNWAIAWALALLLALIELWASEHWWRQARTWKSAYLACYESLQAGSLLGSRQSPALSATHYPGGYLGDVSQRLDSLALLPVSAVPGAPFDIGDEFRDLRSLASSPIVRPTLTENTDSLRRPSAYETIPADFVSDFNNESEAIRRVGCDEIAETG
jgi:hypothetical protein